MTWTIYIQEINDGYLDFQTKEEAWKWLETSTRTELKVRITTTSNRPIQKFDLVHEPD